MLRLCLATALALSGVAALATGEDDPYRLVPDPKAPAVQFPEPPDGMKLAPVPGYQPRVGDRLHLVSEAGVSAIGKDSSDLIDLVKAAVAKDDVGARKLESGKVVGKATSGTEVLVLDRAVAEVQDQEFGIAKVRLVDGPYAGQTAWCVAAELARLVAVPKSRAELKADRDRIRTREFPPDEERARAILLVGRSLEKAGKFGPARENYARVVKEFPATPQAREAAARIEAIKDRK